MTLQHLEMSNFDQKGFCMISLELNNGFLLNFVYCIIEVKCRVDMNLVTLTRFLTSPHFQVVEREMSDF